MPPPLWSLDIDDPLHNHSGVPGHLQPLFVEDPEAEVTSPGGTLASREGAQSQLRHPVRGQHRVGGSLQLNKSVIDLILLYIRKSLQI